MSQEKLHDAIGLLDDDLVEAVDALRSRPRRAAWKQWAAAAACLCVLICGLLAWDGWTPVSPDGIDGPGSGTGDGTDGAAISPDPITSGQISTPATNADGVEAVYFYQALYLRTDGGNEDLQNPRVTVIRSRQELESYYEANKNRYDLERREQVYSDTSIGFLDACDRYDDAYFARNELVLILLEEGSGSVRHQVTAVTKEETWKITVKRLVPEVGTCDMAQWHILVELPGSTDPAEDQNIQVTFRN